MEFNQRAEKSVIFLPLIRGSGEISGHLAKFSLDSSLLKEQILQILIELNFWSGWIWPSCPLSLPLVAPLIWDSAHTSHAALLLRGADSPWLQT